MALFVAAQTTATTIIITDTQDTTNATSLRGAIIAANASGGTNVLVLPNGSYPLSITGNDEDSSFTGDLDITNGNLTIIGSLPSGVTVDATGLGDRVFQVFTNAQLTLSNLVITGGTAPDGAQDGEPGGAIWNAGTLFMQFCTITANSSGNGGYSLVPWNGGNGGGIYNIGTLTMNNCVVTENNCRTGADGYTGAGGNGGNGGGIFNSGTVILQNCSISNNSSGQGTDASSSEGLISIDAPGAPGGSGGAGAGIYNIGDVSLNSCTVNGNSTGPGGAGFAGGSGGNGGAGGNGGGIFNLGTLRLNTCTISGNLCGTGGTGGEGLVVAGGTGGTGGNGGGIYNAGPCDSTSCTIVLNSAGAGGTGGYPDDYGDPGASGGIGGCGGGILNDASVSNVTIRNTLIALNSASPGGLAGGSLSGSTGNPGLDGSGPDGAGDFTSQGFNLIGEVDGIIGFTNAMNADLVGNIANPINPLLGPLQMNGGATFTHALLLGTPAVDQGDSFGIPTDQRGHPRPHGYSTIPNAVGGDGTDIGAFELDLPILNLTKSATNIVISWDTNSSGYILQSTTDLILSNSWTTVTAPVAIAGHQFQVTNSIDAAGTFFRLRTN